MWHSGKHVSVPTFLGCVAAFKIKISSYLRNTIMLVSENIGKRFFVLLSVKKRRKNIKYKKYFKNINK